MPHLIRVAVREGSDLRDELVELLLGAVDPDNLVRLAQVDAFLYPIQYLLICRQCAF